MGRGKPANHPVTGSRGDGDRRDACPTVWSPTFRRSQLHGFGLGHGRGVNPVDLPFVTPHLPFVNARSSFAVPECSMFHASATAGPASGPSDAIALMLKPDLKGSQPAPNRRRWLLGAFFLCWTGLAVVSVWWLIGDKAEWENKVIRMGTDQLKTWSERARETVALARLDFPWAFAWVLFSPYVFWIGARFSFERPHRWIRAAILVAAGACFIVTSQWLVQHLGAGQAMVVVVNYTSRTENGGDKAGNLDTETTILQGLITNRVVTNRFTKVLVSGQSSGLPDLVHEEIASGRFPSALLTNFPPMLTRGMAAEMSASGNLHSGRWSGALDGLAYIALLGLAHAGVFHRRYREREQQAVVLESHLNQARLRALQAQLQPHFLFNTLNGIATLLRRDPAAAEEMLTSLSDLLRIALGSSERQEIPLREELDFLARYLAIQRMRFGERLQVREEIEPAAMEYLVPALLLQPLVENAIHHGLEPSGNPGQVLIAAAREGDWLSLRIEDNGIGLSGSASNVGGGAGVGLANVRERLAALHGSAHEFRIEERPEGGVTVKIRLPARHVADAGSGKEAHGA